MLKTLGPRDIGRWLGSVFDYSSIRYGDIAKKQGDIVIVNCTLQPFWRDYVLRTGEVLTVETMLKDVYPIDRIVTTGIYTNVYWTGQYILSTLDEVAKRH